jgi:hypothetical protein
MISRRQWLAAAAGAGLPARAASGSLLFEGYPIPARSVVQEATLSRLDDGRYWLLFGENNLLVGKFSSDRGRTWGPVQPVLEKGGAPIAMTTAGAVIERSPATMPIRKAKA